jgi:hypothetical protein
MHSVFASLNLREFWKGLVIAFFTALFLAVKDFFEANMTIPILWSDWKSILIVSAGTGFAYIGTTFFSNSEGAIMKKEKLL